MIYTVFDIETTGLSKYECGIVQFAYIRLNNNLTPVKCGAFYLYPPENKFRWDADAEKVHRLSREFLKENAIDYDVGMAQIYALLQYSNVITYNGNTFDIPFTSNVLQKSGLIPLQCIGFNDVMLMCKERFGRKPKLVDVPAILGLNPAVMQTLCNAYFKGVNVRPHDASYDTTVTYMAYRKLLDMGRIKPQQQQESSISYSSTQTF